MGAHLHPHHAPLAKLFLDAVAAPSPPAPTRASETPHSAPSRSSPPPSPNAAISSSSRKSSRPSCASAWTPRARGTNPTNRDESAASAALRAPPPPSPSTRTPSSVQNSNSSSPSSTSRSRSARTPRSTRTPPRARTRLPFWRRWRRVAEALDEPRRCQTSHASDVVSAAALMLPPLRGRRERWTRRTRTRLVRRRRRDPRAARAALRRCATRLCYPSATLSHVARPVLDAAATGAVPLRGRAAALAVVVEGCASEMAEDAVLVPTLGALDAAIRSGDARRGARRRSRLGRVGGARGPRAHPTPRRRRASARDERVAHRGGRRVETRRGRRIRRGGGVLRPTHAALASLCENFSNEELAPGVDALARTLVAGAACAGAPPGARARCLTTLAAVARAAAWDFEPYARETLDALAALADEGANNKARTRAREREREQRDSRARARGDGHGGGGGGRGFGAARRHRRASRRGDARRVHRRGWRNRVDDARVRALRCFGRLATTLETRVAPWIDVATGAALRALERDRASAVVGGGRHGRSAVTTGNARTDGGGGGSGAVVNALGSAARPAREKSSTRSPPPPATRRAPCRASPRRRARVGVRGQPVGERRGGGRRAAAAGETRRGREHSRRTRRRRWRACSRGMTRPRWRWRRRRRSRR